MWKSSLDAVRGNVTEWVLFWAFLAGLAWAPYYYGSNDLWAWGINAILFPGLVIAYEVGLMARAKHHPVAISEIGLPALLFLIVVAWIMIQNAPWTPSAWHHPIWAMTAEALQQPIDGSISVNHDPTALGLLRLITAASVFWIALQLGRNPHRASYFVAGLVSIVCAYAIYGLINLSLAPQAIHWMGTTWSSGFVTSTFVNRNHFGTYVGMGLVAIAAIIFKLYRRELKLGGPLRFKIASVIETTFHRGALLIAAAVVLLVTLLLTASRGAIVATGAGLFVLVVLALGGRNKAFSGRRELVLGLSFVAAIFLLVFGDLFFGQVAERGLSDQSRIAVYLITLRSIIDAPLLGYGYGTFYDVFPMFRDQSIDTGGIWEYAHNSYLEVFQGLGLLFGSALLACIFLLVSKCFKGAIARDESTVPSVAASVACLVGIHALADFSLQMQAVTLTFAAILGVGVAQSKSSKLALND
jgi:O-antigen ligase